MANTEHLEWLREGVGAWNRRYKNQPFDPDLSSLDVSRNLGGHEREDIRQISVQLKGINLSKADLRDSTLRDTDLSGSNIWTANLTNSSLEGSNLTRAFVLGSSLRNAVLRHADLSNARIWKSDLSLAWLNGANLSGAQIWQSNLEGAHLYSANLNGVNFSQSRPWLGRLFLHPEQTNVGTSSFDRGSICGINDLLEECREFRKTHRNEIVLYFRGESDSSWDLKPSIMRVPKCGKANLRPFEGDILNDLITRRPGDFIQEKSAIAQWVLAQHYGLKTRLLDITRNPLVALFNACHEYRLEDGGVHVFAVPRSLIKPFNSDTVSVVANFAKLPRSEQNILLGKSHEDARGDSYPRMENSVMDWVEAYPKAMKHLYALIRQERPYFEERIDIRDFYRVIVVEPELKFERIRAQAGAFLTSAFHERFERGEVLRINRETPVYAHFFLKVPSDQKQDILDDLQLLNTTRETLYPGIDEATRAVIERFENRRPEM